MKLVVEDSLLTVLERDVIWPETCDSYSRNCGLAQDIDFLGWWKFCLSISDLFAICCDYESIIPSSNGDESSRDRRSDRKDRDR